MKKISILLGALLLGISGLASASTTVLDVSGKLSGLLDAKTYSFDITQSGVYDASFSVTSSKLALVLFGVFDKVGNTWVPVNGTVGSGSFDFVGNTNTQYKAVVGDLNLAANKLKFNINISGLASSGPGGGTTPPVPEPETWAIMLLGIGFVVYQVRPRKMQGSMSIPSLA